MVISEPATIHVHNSECYECSWHVTCDNLDKTETNLMIVRKCALRFTIAIAIDRLAERVTNSKL